MSTLSDALAAMDKATPGPWDYDSSDGRIYADGAWIGDVDLIGQATEEEVDADGIIQAAAPDALAWIKEAVEYLKEFRPDVATEVKMWKGRPREKYLAERLQKLDTLIAQVKE